MAIYVKISIDVLVFSVNIDVSGQYTDSITSVDEMYISLITLEYSMRYKLTSLFLGTI